LARIVREFRGARDDAEMRRVYERLKALGLKPFYLKCKGCGAWMFVFSRNVKPSDYLLIFQEYVDMLLNDYGSNITCPECGVSNLQLLDEFRQKFRVNFEV